MRTGFRLPILAIALLAGAALAQAQALRDPTRPPGAAAVRGMSGLAPSGDLVLQSVLISPQRRAAIISGRVIRPGETVDGYRLIAIREGEAVLRRGDQSRTLRLYPAVDLSRPALAAGDTQSKPRKDMKKKGAESSAQGG